MTTRRARVVVTWFVAVAGVLAVSRLVIALPEHCGSATPAAVNTAIDDLVAWLTVNQQPDGTWLYRYRASTDEDLGGYNWVRHAGVMLSLYQAAAAGESGALDVADRGRAAVF